MAANDQSGLRCKSADFTFDGGDVTIVVPDGWHVENVVLNIQTAFDGTGTISVGYTGATDAFLAAQTAQGYYRANEGAGASADGRKLGVGEDVVIDVFAGTAAQGAGEVYVMIAPVLA